MKLFLSVSPDNHDVDKISEAIHSAKLTDYHTVRDYHSDGDQKHRWSVIRDEIGACDGLLIDVSVPPNDGQMIEVGIAYSLRLPVIAVKKHGARHNHVMDGVSEQVIEYDDYKDLAQKLKRFDHDRSFNVTDKSMMLVMFLLVGVVIGWQAWLLFAPLAIIVPVIYWLIVRQFFVSMRVFDRVVILIPIALLWLSGLWWLKGISIPLAAAWTLVYWVVAIIFLRKFKVSL